METILSVIVGCLSIGIILSAPMGPIGILCIQRTLSKGRMSGLCTGVGAAISDLIYCLLAGLGLSIVTDFIRDNQSVLQVVGSIVLLVFAAFLIWHNPVKKIKTSSDDKENYVQDIVTGFLFTLSNPLIIFLIFPLFARFNFPSPELQFYHYIIGYVFIVGGALLWWLMITFFVDKVREHFNIRSMWLLNRIIGSIILLLSLYGLFTGVRDYFHL